MIAAVLDTNILVSGVIESRGIPFRLIQAARNRVFTVVTSRAIIDELLRALRRDRIRRKYAIGPDKIEDARLWLEGSIVVTPSIDTARGVASHPEDDLILATALAGEADYLVTGDHALQQLGTFHGIRIVSPRSFLTLIAPETT